MLLQWEVNKFLTIVYVDKDTGVCAAVHGLLLPMTLRMPDVGRRVRYVSFFSQKKFTFLGCNLMYTYINYYSSTSRIIES